MAWISIVAIVLAVIALVVINQLTDAGNILNCQTSGRTSPKTKRRKDERDLKEEEEK